VNTVLQIPLLFEIIQGARRRPPSWGARSTDRFEGLVRRQPTVAERLVILEEEESLVRLRFRVDWRLTDLSIAALVRALPSLKRPVPDLTNQNPVWLEQDVAVIGVLSLFDHSKVPRARLAAG
jgi:hypothetical protein